MPRMKSEVLGTGDQSWLGSAHGIRNCRTETINVSAFTAGTHYPNGYIPSGTPVAKVGGLLVPYDSLEATTTGAGVLAGHLFTDQRVVGTGNFSAPVLDHGRVKSAKVPTGVQAFTVPVAAAKRAAMTIVYI
jgi:hypothetical protein